MRDLSGCWTKRTPIGRNWAGGSGLLFAAAHSDKREGKIAGDSARQAVRGAPMDASRHGVGLDAYGGTLSHAKSSRGRGVTHCGEAISCLGQL